MHHFWLAQDESLKVHHILGLLHYQLHGYVISVNTKEHARASTLLTHFLACSVL